MTGPALVFLLVNVAALLILPRRWAVVPLLVGACYMTLEQGFNIGPFRFTVIRALALAGFIRVLVRGERPAGGINGLDWVMVIWALAALWSSLFHNSPKEALIFRLGLVYNVLGIYFLVRCFCRTFEEVIHLIGITALILLPVAVEMVLEHVTGRNFFAILGGGSDSIIIRGDRARARGPFGHPILAGTVGAVCAPLMIGLWNRHRNMACLGLGVCLVMVVASNSSGPIMSLVFGLFAVLLWRLRRYTSQMRIAAVIGYIILDIVMKAPAYYLIARIDLTGSSTGWHRARLMESAFEHVGEWWFAGTDYTRHWMPTGVSWSPDHTDITNYYIKMGVWGGFPLMFLFIGALALAFSYVGRAIRASAEGDWERQFLVWCIGAALFSHTATGISVSYFDQSFVFVYFTLAMISSLWAGMRAQEVPESTPLSTEARQFPHGVTEPALPGPITLDGPGPTHAGN